MFSRWYKCKNHRNTATSHENQAQKLSNEKTWRQLQMKQLKCTALRCQVSWDHTGRFQSNSLTHRTLRFIFLTSPSSYQTFPLYHPRFFFRCLLLALLCLYMVASPRNSKPVVHCHTNILPHKQNTCKYMHTCIFFWDIS